MNEHEIPNVVHDVTPLMNEVKYQEALRMKEEYERKRQFRHDWLLATFSTVSGAVFGFLGSLVFWLIEK